MSTDDDFSTTKMYLQGLISRDVSSPGAPDPERAKQRAAGNLRLVALTEPGSIKWLEVDRAGLLKLIDEGWVFDGEISAWAEEEQK